MKKLCTVSKNKTGVDYSSNHKPLTAKLRLKFKKVGKTTRPFRYGLQRTPYDNTVKVTNRFKGLNLGDRVSKELWTEVCNIVQEAKINSGKL